MKTCAKIASSLVLAACVSAAVGLESSIYIVNFDDIDRASSTVTGNVISSLVLNTGANGYKYESAKNAIEANSPLNKGTYLNRFDHNIVFRVFSKTQSIKDELGKLAQARVVVIVENLNSGSDETHFEVYGWDAGLEMTDFQAATTDGDGVVATVTLNSGDNAKESDLPKSFYSTSLATTRAALEALLPAPASSSSSESNG